MRNLPKITRTLPKIIEDHTNPSKAFRRSPEHIWRFPKNTRTLPKVSEDHPNTSENLRKSPEISEDHRIFSKLFQVLEDWGQYLLHTSVVNVWSEALSCLFCVNFFKDHKLHSPYGLVQLCWFLKKFTRAYLFQIALEIMWLSIQKLK